MSKEDRSTHLRTADEIVKNVFFESLKVKAIDSKEAKKEAEKKYELAKLAGKMHDAAHASITINHDNR